MFYCMQVDIIGGSLAGLACAITLKKDNPSCDVIVHEKHRRIGFNHEGRRCAEAHTLLGSWAHWKPEPDAVFTDITHGEVFCGNKKQVFEQKPGTGVILNRQAFIAQLGRQAEEYDVHIHTNDKIVSSDELSSDYIVDASGCPSIIKRSWSRYPGLRGFSLQQTIVDSKVCRPNCIEMYFVGDFGYCWLFPRDISKSEVNVGLVMYGKRWEGSLKQKLEEFKIKRGICGKVSYCSGGLIPCGLQPPFKKKNILFVGDSGVGTFAFSFQGIYRALLSGEIAGRCLAKNKPSDYPKLMISEFGKWEVIGRVFTSSNLIARHISPTLVFGIINSFMQITRVSH